MLGKLCKYEIKNLTKYWIFIFPIMFGSGLILAAMERFIPEQSSIKFAIQGIFGLTYAASIVAAFLITLIIIVMRYYIELFQNQGYLNFTLPVKNTDHYFCRLLMGAAAIFATAILVWISLESTFWIMFGHSITNEFLTNPDYYAIFDIMYGTTGKILIPILLVLGVFTAINQIFTCITIGQMFKNRILAAVIAYFSIYFISQTLSTIYLITTTVTNIAVSGDYTQSNQMTSILLFSLIFQVIANAVFVFVNTKIINTKLNLE